MSSELANNFCSACGGNLIPTAIICPKCGSPTARYSVQKTEVPKSKTAAVLLSVFLGTWSWLYTYKVNRTKFWVTLTTYLAMTIVIVLRAFYLSDRAHYGIYPDVSEMVLWKIIAYLWLFTPVGFWIWAIVDHASKPSSWYETYPNQK